ncbi:peptide chain release factor 2 [Candidatus Wirthbacteria bacterium CG2_30_54_11]|uniref:Peptide chain release factor 2 n=1 Tax=Candidatus Wirthbacteria bacterium CG2_30_54_11 TaxID=1817892 RepID=A0A1J5IK79_9BACT|nr:MAG: peptide chain release factor 2 [Candidatus Wirthbacteria bacterium CG2_30_54_11]
MKVMGRLNNEITRIEKVEGELAEIREFIELNDPSLVSDLTEKMQTLEQELGSMELLQMFSGTYDQSDAVLSIHAGTGGIDAQDWAQMLERMYLRYFEKKGWKATLLHMSDGEEGGIKSADIEVSGERVYGHLKAEHGVHRLVRLSPFNSNHTRETSFSLVEVVPLLDQLSGVAVQDEEIRIDTFRARGHGGQGVNTTDSAVRITHLSTGLVVSCQNERSQLQNKRVAMQIILSRLQLLQDEKFQSDLKSTKGEYKQGSWGNQIRSYVLQPYTMVKDHRTEHEVSDVGRVLDGDLDEFILAWLTSR